MHGQGFGDVGSDTAERTIIEGRSGDGKADGRAEHLGKVVNLFC